MHMLDHKWQTREPAPKPILELGNALYCKAIAKVQWLLVPNRTKPRKEIPRQSVSLLVHGQGQNLPSPAGQVSTC